MASNNVSKTLVWILMGLLILGLGGFGVTNLSGTIRTVGSVGDAEITVDEYARALQNEIRALEAEREEPVSFAQAEAQGIDQRVLSRLIANAALDHEAQRLGISIGDENLLEQIVDIRAFQGVNGEFDREAYGFALDQAGMSEAEFESDIRAETARTLLQAAVVSGVSAPPEHTEILLRYLAERRDLTFAVLDRTDLDTELPDPTDADLRTYHQSHLPDFTTPETRAITYAWLTPDMLLDTVEVDEGALRDAYEARADEFRRPERRLVERLVFADRAAARDAKARIEAGETTFEDLVEDRGLELGDVDMGDVTREDLGDGAATVFGAKPGEIAGPVPSSLGPALYRVNGVLAAQTTTFDEARPELREALAADRARRAVDSRIERIENLLAGGATIEDLAAETDMRMGQIDWHEGLRDGIASYAGFRRKAQSITPEDFPELEQLSDGGIFALRLDKLRDPEIQPLEEVRNSVETAWRRQAQTDALRAQVEAQSTGLPTGEEFEALNLEATEVNDLTRRGFQPDTPPEFIDTVFSMEAGELRILDGEGRVFVLRLDDIEAPDTDDPDVGALHQNLEDSTAAGLSQDLYQALANDIRSRAGIELNQQALNAVHANFQ